LAKAVEDRFNIFSNNASARKSYLNRATEAKGSGEKLRVWDESTKSWVDLTPDQAADLCMSVVDTWFNGTFPRPSTEYEDKFKKPNWSHDTLKAMASAHIRLKNWALDLGKSESQRVGHKFPDDAFSINVFGLNKANRDAIASFEAVKEQNLAEVNPLAAINEMVTQTQPDGNNDGNMANSKIESSSIFTPKNIAIGAATATAVAIAMAVILGRSGRNK
jgi:hypothetical protein